VGYAYAAILLSPFAIGGLIGASAPAKSFIAWHHRGCAALGWTAFALVPVAAFTLHGASQVAALAILCPFTALTWWRSSDDPGWDDDGGDDPDPVLPEPPDIDWERFMRDFDEYVASRRA
jgi:hypothetical protein